MLQAHQGAEAFSTDAAERRMLYHVVSRNVTGCDLPYIQTHAMRKELKCECCQANAVPLATDSILCPLLVTAGLACKIRLRGKCPELTETLREL